MEHSANNSEYRYLGQNLSFEIIPSLAGKKVTWSILVGEINAGAARAYVYVDSSVFGMISPLVSGVNTITFTMPNTLTASTAIQVRLQLMGVASIDVIAAKLELGSTQTLAHQDADGNWVLNEIPDYGEELLKCCMSTADTSDTYANNKKTPAALGAVNKAGDTMTGSLKFAKVSNGYSTLEKDHSATADQGLKIRDYDADGNYLVLKLSAKQNVFQLYQNGGFKNILHTGNKPSGSYTGTGEAWSEPLNTGGIGDVIAVCSQNGFALVVGRSGGLTRGPSSGLGTLTSNEAVMSGGKLTVSTANSQINASGITYYYQVL